MIIRVYLCSFMLKKKLYAHSCLESADLEHFRCRDVLVVRPVILPCLEA